MNYQEYLNRMKEIQDKILVFLEREDNVEENYENLTKSILINNFNESKHETKSLIFLISNIANNHYRTPHFFDKIKQILQYLKNSIQKYFTNSEIFDIFQENNILILYFIEENMLFIDNYIYDKVKKNLIFTNFFHPEIEAFIDEEDPPLMVTLNYYDNPKEKDINIFKSKRQIGENGNYINEIIRKDSIDEFTNFVTEKNIPLDSYIKKSIYETNTFLIKKQEIQFIKYAAFFGSIQIFNYLLKNGIELKPSLWIYAIHGNNLEIIKILEEIKIIPKDNTYEQCMKEAIKCHHNDIANYILNNHLNMNVETRNRELNAAKNMIQYSFQYSNYYFIPNELNNNFIFYYACIYDYYQISEYFIKTKKVDFNEKIISFFLLCL